MNNYIPIKKSVEPNQIITKYFAVITTLIYAVLFPCFLWMSIFSLVFLEGDKRPFSIGLMMVAAVLSIPLSMPASVYLMWSNFCNQKYKKTLWWGGLPLAIFIAAEFLIDVIAPLFRF